MQTNNNAFSGQRIEHCLSIVSLIGFRNIKEVHEKFELANMYEIGCSHFASTYFVVLSISIKLNGYVSAQCVHVHQGIKHVALPLCTLYNDFLVPTIQIHIYSESEKGTQYKPFRVPVQFIWSSEFVDLNYGSHTLRNSENKIICFIV